MALSRARDCAFRRSWSSSVRPQMVIVAFSASLNDCVPISFFATVLRLRMASDGATNTCALDLESGTRTALSRISTLPVMPRAAAATRAVASEGWCF